MDRQRQASAPTRFRGRQRDIFQPEEKLATMPVKILKGITHSKKINNIRIRITGILFICAIFIYIPWLIYNLNTQALWLSVPFLVVNLYTTILVVTVIFNNWSKAVPLLFKLPEGSEDVVAVIIPTYGEPLEMLQLTIESVLQQNWPHDKLVIVMGDDGHRDEVRTMIERLQLMHASTPIIYHRPPGKKSPQRKGSAKDGNLNSMLDFISQHYPTIKYIETRDADDLVGDPNFLRYTIGHLISSPKTAYVQTIKEAYVSPGDPFGNTQAFFYRELMFSKNAANAVFPCGSGLVWRKEALDKIGGFPTWNLVEDLYSGYVAMQHGFKNIYLPIVGAVGQTAPEDIPNVYKQLGTWALDTFRIYIWKNPWLVKGLTFKQRMQFTELGLFYSIGIPLLVMTLVPACNLIFGVQPIQSDGGNYVLHAWTFAALLEVLFLNLGGNTSFKNLWRGREMCFGLMFVYIKACFLAVVYGPNKKPTYKVTRKVQQAGFYFKETFFHIVLLLTLVFAMVYHLATQQNILDSDFGSLGWALFYAILLFGFIRKSWFGVGKKKATEHPIEKKARDAMRAQANGAGAVKSGGLLALPAPGMGTAFSGSSVYQQQGQISGSASEANVPSPALPVPLPTMALPAPRSYALAPVPVPDKRATVADMQTLVSIPDYREPAVDFRNQATPEPSRFDYAGRETMNQRNTPREGMVAQPDTLRKPKKQFILPPTMK